MTNQTNTSNEKRIAVELNGDTGYFVIVDSSDKAIKVCSRTDAKQVRTMWLPKSGFEVTTSKGCIDHWTAKTWFSSKASSFQQHMVFVNGTKSQFTRGWR